MSTWRPGELWGDSTRYTIGLLSKPLYRMATQSNRPPIAVETTMRPGLLLCNCASSRPLTHFLACGGLLVVSANPRSVIAILHSGFLAGLYLQIRQTGRAGLWRERTDGAQRLRHAVNSSHIVFLRSRVWGGLHNKRFDARPTTLHQVLIGFTNGLQLFA